MSYKCRILPQAKKDLQEAASYYNKQQKNLGRRFLKEVNARVAAISKNPQTCQIRYREVRMALLNKFPYSLHYLIDEDQNQIIILSVFHQAQNPANWREEY
jgi:plasmid stabilization system protein ParE